MERKRPMDTGVLYRRPEAIVGLGLSACGALLGPEGGGGGEVGAGSLAHARAFRDVITKARRVERGLHEPREGHHAGAGPAAKQGDEGVVSGGGFHRTSVAGTFRLRQTKRG